MEKELEIYYLMMKQRKFLKLVKKIVSDIISGNHDAVIVKK